MIVPPALGEFLALCGFSNVGVLGSLGLSLPLRFPLGTTPLTGGVWMGARGSGERGAPLGGARRLGAVGRSVGLLGLGDAAACLLPACFWGFRSVRY